MSKNYLARAVSAADAVRAGIKDNNLVVFSHAAATPRLCIEAMAEHYRDFHNVGIYHMLTLGEAPYTLPEMEGHFRHITNFVGANTRTAIAEGRADFFPAFFHEIPKLMRRGTLRPDVAVVQLSEPNEEGYCSFGLASDYTKPAAETAPVVIGEINKQMPFIGGDNLIHIDELQYIVAADYAIPEIPQPEIGETELAIGNNVASLIKNGDTLQLGIGAIPDAVLRFLGDKRDLGIHTEMFSDGVLDLVRQGVINGRCKEVLPGKLVATFLMGTRALYEFADKNPNVELYPVDFVNDPVTIMKFSRIISINSCIEVDLQGQVCSETIGLKQFSGTGGQVDYVRGAAMSEHGISIMAMPATARKGKSSRIVPLLAEGAAVTTGRCDVDYVVTEYGIAALKGKTLRDRALALIEIAHPDFRNELHATFAERFPSR